MLPMTARRVHPACRARVEAESGLGSCVFDQSRPKTRAAAARGDAQFSCYEPAWAAAAAAAAATASAAGSTICVGAASLVWAIMSREDARCVGSMVWSFVGFVRPRQTRLQSYACDSACATGQREGPASEDAPPMSACAGGLAGLSAGCTGGHRPMEKALWCLHVTGGMCLRRQTVLNIRICLLWQRTGESCTAWCSTSDGRYCVLSGSQRRISADAEVPQT